MADGLSARLHNALTLFVRLDSVCRILSHGVMTCYDASYFIDSTTRPYLSMRQSHQYCSVPSHITRSSGVVFPRDSPLRRPFKGERSTVACGWHHDQDPLVLPSQNFPTCCAWIPEIFFFLEMGPFAPCERRSGHTQRNNPSYL